MGLLLLSAGAGAVSVSNTATTLLEANQGIEQSRASPFEALKQLSPSVIVLIEGTQGITKPIQVLYEGLQGIEQSGITLIEAISSAVPVEQSAITLIESCQSIDSVRVTIYEILQQISQEQAVLIEGYISVGFSVVVQTIEVDGLIHESIEVSGYLCEE